MQNYVIAGVAAASLTIGAASGYFFAKKQMKAEYEEQISKEIKEAKAFYKAFYADLSKQKYQTPTEAAEALIPEHTVQEAAEAMRRYQATDTGTIFGEQAIPDAEIVEDESVEVEVEERNIFDNGDQLKIDRQNRDTSKPYVVDEHEWLSTPEGFEEVSLTYYSGDGVLGDDQDEPVENVDELIGNMNLMMFGASDPANPHILLVRNEKKKLDLEITWSDGKFAHEVLGFEHSDEPTTRRVKPRWDDE